MPTRRDFLRSSSAAAALLAGTPLAALAHSARTIGRAPMNLLILGGTGFIGPHLVRHAVAQGHRVTIFTRGRRDADLPASVERLVGDRNGQLQALENRRWDAVFDDSATNPDWVRMSTALLKDQVGRYLFTSSTGVYYPYLKVGLDESTPVRTELTDPQDGSASFGVNKARCERHVLETFGDRGLVVRPTYIIGPGDTTDRFPYWPARLARGGEVLAPGRTTDRIQIIDVRDLAEFMLRVVEQGRSGIYNVAGPRDPMTMPEFLAAARDAMSANVTFTQVDDYAFLREHRINGAVPWIRLDGNDLGHTSASNARAIAAGLAFRPLAMTVRDTRDWWPTVPAERRAAPRFAISAEQERTALAAWKERGLS